MKIRSIQDFRDSTEKVIANAIANLPEKAHSIFLEVGKALFVASELHPSAKTQTAAFRACGGIGKPHDHAVMMANVVRSYVATGYLDELAYDAAKANDCKVASPIANLLKKHEAIIPPAFAESAKVQVGKIMTAKPEDSGKQLKAIRQQIEELAGEKPQQSALEAIEKAINGNVDKLTAEDIPGAVVLLEGTAGSLDIDTTATERLEKTLNKIVATLDDSDIDDAHEIIVAALHVLADRAIAREEQLVAA